MMRVIDAGYVLKNRIDDEQRDLAIFDIEGPDVPDCEFVDICMSDNGKVWVSESKEEPLSIEEVARFFNIPLQFLAQK